MGIYEVDGETDDIVSMADRAYIARQTIKNKGDTAWAFYDGAVRDKLLHEKEIESQMEKALAEGEFIAYYQPKYSTKEQKLIGAEALVRWRRSVTVLLFRPINLCRFLNVMDLSIRLTVICSNSSVASRCVGLNRGLYLCQYQSICRGCACMIRILLTNISVF